MFNGLVLPHFTYCSTVWNDGCRAHIDKLYKMQKRAARAITGSNYEIRSKEIFEKLGWEPIENMYKKRDINMTFRALRGELPEYISKMFTINHNNAYHLRSNDCKLHLDKPNTDFMKKSFSYRGASAWNNLPNDITAGHAQLSRNSFKNLLNGYFGNLTNPL